MFAMVSAMLVPPSFIRQGSEIGNSKRETSQKKASINSLPIKVNIFGTAFSQKCLQVGMRT
jgi:hypothetical protein